VKNIYFSFLIIISAFFSVLANADTIRWTEKKLGKVILQANYAASKKEWARAIEYGEKMLAGSKALDHANHPRYINLLKNLNRYYDKQNRLREISERVTQAYQLSKENFGLTHKTTTQTRYMYFKLLISEKKYTQAIPLVREAMSALGNSQEDKFKLHGYLKQLYSLHGLAGQFEEEEKILHQYLELNNELLGPEEDDETKTVFVVLAKNYCRQNKIEEFHNLVRKHQLNYKCENLQSP